jgi:hypothetical protein
MRGWVVSATHRPLYRQERHPVPIVQEAVWAPGPVWMGGGNLAPTGIRSPDRPARSQSLYRPTSSKGIMVNLFLSKARKSYNLRLTLDGDEWSISLPSLFVSGEETRYSWFKRPDGAQRRCERSGEAKNILSLPRSVPHTIHSLPLSLYRLSHQGSSVRQFSI